MVKSVLLLILMPMDTLSADSIVFLNFRFVVVVLEGETEAVENRSEHKKKSHIQTHRIEN